MSAEKRWRLICYDVRDPKRYRKAYKLIRGAGRSVQYSVFRCRLDDVELEKLRWELSKVLDASDRLLVVDLCPSCAERVISRNHVDGWIRAPEPFRVLQAGGPVDHGPVGGKGRERGFSAKLACTDGESASLKTE